MDATVREKNRYGSGVEIVSRNGDCTVYRLFDSTGEQMCIRDRGKITNPCPLERL